jgi:hypothetical protein
LNLPKFEEILTSPMAAPLGSLQSWSARRIHSHVQNNFSVCNNTQVGYFDG